MRVRTVCLFFLFTLLCWGILAAKDKNSWWSEPFTQWNQGETTEMFTDSPWVKVQTYSFESMQGSMGQNENKYQFIVRLFSAQPVREAYVRMIELMNNYDTLSPDRQKELDSKVLGIANADPGDEVIVAIAYASSDQEGSRDMKRFWDTASAATLSQSAYLYTSSAGQITLKNYVPPAGGIGCRLVFPRTYKGNPILLPTDKEMRFQVYVPRIGQNLEVGFKPAQMVYKGKFSY